MSLISCQEDCISFPEVQKTYLLILSLPFDIFRALTLLLLQIIFRYVTHPSTIQTQTHLTIESFF